MARMSGPEREERSMAAEEFLDPTDSVAVPRKTAARLPSLEGKVITLLDISKAKGDHLLDRVEELLHERLHPKAATGRGRPTSRRPAPKTRGARTSNRGAPSSK